MGGQVTGWTLVKEDSLMKLRQSWKVKSFTKGLEFFKIVADLAEKEGVMFCFHFFYCSLSN